MRARLGCVALVAAVLAGCGGEAEEAPVERGDPFTAVRPDEVLTPEERDRAAPRWAELTTFSGAGDVTRELAIPGDSIQWRMRWSCIDGTELVMELEPAPPSGAELVNGSCPGAGEATGVTGGRYELTVRADGEWGATVEHQVDAPLHEPPLPEMRKGRLIAEGGFAPIERKGRGTAQLFRLPGGRLALRLEDFETTASSDLEVWVSPAPRPQTSRAAVRAEHVSAGPLKSTAGAHNYLLPEALDPEDVRSIVLWCEPLYMAYAAAELRPAG